MHASLIKTYFRHVMQNSLSFIYHYVWKLSLFWYLKIEFIFIIHFYTSLFYWGGQSHGGFAVIFIFIHWIVKLAHCRDKSVHWTENQTLDVHIGSIYCDHIVTLTSQKHTSTKTSVIEAKQTVINEVYVCSIKYRNNVYFIEKYINFIYSAD